jgi:hypothetical protein
LKAFRRLFGMRRAMASGGGYVMATRKDTSPNGPGSPVKNPDDWKTGDEPLTGAQRSYLETLATEAGESVAPDNLTKAEASKKIDELQEKTGRGDDSTPVPTRRHDSRTDG